MKVQISVHGRFHGFDLARELQQLDALQTLISSYPAMIATRFNIPKEKYHSILEVEILARMYRKLPLMAGQQWRLSPMLNHWYDKRASACLRPGDIFVGWSGSSLLSLAKAKSLGMKTVLERGSSHIVYQTEILAEEYKKHGLGSANIAHEKIIQRELQEYEQTDFIAIPSQFVKQSFLQKGVAENKLIHVPYGVNLDEFYPVQKNDKVFRFIHCGSLSLRKGVHYLLQAFSELALPNVELWLVGSVSSEIQPYLKKYAKDNIVVHGHQAQNTLKWFYSQCNVFCLASIEEGLAMVQAQAMSCGLPVLCSENTGGADIVEHGVSGYVLPVGDVHALKEKMQELFEDRGRCQAMASAARLRIKDQFSWRSYGEKTLQAYRKILSPEL